MEAAMHTKTLSWGVRLLLAALLIAALISLARGQEMFPSPSPYQAWRNGGCCGQGDCYSTSATFKNGLWTAVRREDGKPLAIPWNKVDYGIIKGGKAHLCAPKPGDPNYEKDHVHCFQPPEGGA